ncbi:hypothetical protein [Novosphingobium sp.]|uniref:hypothetical protein n=1 Tax=Novosphingobium sp. TaxID=1874826 RepID=UPI0025DB6AC9|nr:hypothetical protein [Novosphingobium sp.]
MALPGALLAGLAGIALAKAAPAALPGAEHWQVVHTFRDPAVSNVQGAFLAKDDPRLVGRELVLGPKAVQINFFGFGPNGSEANLDACSRVVKTNKNTRLSTLLTAKLQKPTTQPGPTPQNMGLGRDRVVLATQYRCQGTPYSGVNGMATARLGPNLLLAILDDQGTLLLEPWPVKGPGPGFDCSAAASSDLARICRNAALTSLYRSVATAAARNRSLATDPVLATLQKEYLTKRAACGTDDGCIGRAMSEWLGYLMQ